ncbi:MAG: ABC transporter ATP-binding protein [Proteobacteria bacterium]|nr:ABC transporter ATP-binding protein [Pseudomonadota bacterium]
MPDPVPAALAGSSVTLRGVRKEFPGGVVAIDPMDLDVAAGEFLAILGPSGCGKSTLLRMISGLERPTAGTVEVHRPSTTGHAGRFDIAYVFQDAHLLPWRTVLSNAAMPLELRGIGRAERQARAADALANVGLGDALARYPNQLSGGMRMRVSLARAMVTDPTLLLLDEPFAALDEITRQRLDEQLRELWQARRMTVIFVTHSTTEAVFLADRAVVMSKRPGRIISDRAVALAPARVGALRGTADFVHETRIVYEALERGEASA